MIDWIRKAVPADRGYDDAAYLAAVAADGPASDAASLLHPVNYLSEAELTAVEVRWERRCASYTVRGHRCKRQGTCWSAQSGRLCVQHMREAEPNGIMWL